MNYELHAHHLQHHSTGYEEQFWPLGFLLIVCLLESFDGNEFLKIRGLVLELLDLVHCLHPFGSSWKLSAHHVVKPDLNLRTSLALDSITTGAVIDRFYLG